MMLRPIAILLLGLAGIVGLGMSLCGGAFTLAGLIPTSDHGEFPASGFLIISVPSLLIGLAILTLVVRKVRRMDRQPDAAEQSIDDGR